VFQEAVHEVLPRLLAIADDVDTGILLDLEGKDRRVAFGLGQGLAVEPPRWP
jgi:hypothetical protein